MCIVGCAALSMGSCGKDPGGDSTVRNIVLITLDTLRADHLHCYGYERETSAGIDSLAAAGVRFHRAYAPISSTGPSHASLFTGLYPPSHGVVANGMRLSDDIRVWAEFLKDEGFATAAFTNNYPFRKHGLWRGFDVAHGNPDDQAKGIEDRIFAWADSVGAAKTGDRFLLWVHLYTVHAPYSPPRKYLRMFTDPDYAGRFWANKGTVDRILENGIQLTEEEATHFMNLYDAEIVYTDEKIVGILNGLKTRGILDDTVVILTADHGEMFSRGIYADHEPSVFEGTLRIPLIMNFPNGRHAGTEVANQVVELIDVLPTAFELLGVPVPPDLQGRSLVPLIRGQDDQFDDADSVAFAIRSSYFKPHKTAAVFRVWKLIETVDGDPELYHLGDDPLELSNLADERPDVVEALGAQIDAWSEGVVERAAAEEITDPETLETLRALGYVR